MGYGGLFHFKLSTKAIRIKHYSKPSVDINCVGSYQDSSNVLYNFIHENDGADSIVYLMIVNMNTLDITFK